MSDADIIDAEDRITPEETCPNCEEPYQVKLEYGIEQDWSLSTEDPIQRLCAFNLPGSETWVYVHMENGDE